MDKIRSKWDFLLQCRPDVRGMMGNTNPVGGHVSHNGNQHRIFTFVTRRGTFSYNEATDEFKSELQIR